VSGEGRSIETASGPIMVREDGRPESPALVLCQRFRGQIDDWDPRFIAALARERRVIVSTCPGSAPAPGRFPTASGAWPSS